MNEEKVCRYCEKKFKEHASRKAVIECLDGYEYMLGTRIDSFSHKMEGIIRNELRDNFK